MKEFWIYTGLRLGLFLACYAVFMAVAVYALDVRGGNLVWPFLLAVLVSMVLSLRLLKGPRERFARRVDERARRASQRFEEMRSKEDAD